MVSTKRLDHWMSRILFITESETGVLRKNSPVFGLALFISAMRCTLQYVVFPFMLPFFGIIGNTPRWLSLSLNAIALTSLFTSLRRYWKVNHPRRFAYLPLALLMFIVLGIFVLSDLELLHL